MLFVKLIIFGLGFLIFIFAAPMLYTIISESLPGVGSATAFVMKIFLWVILFVLIGFFINLVSGGERPF